MDGGCTDWCGGAASVSTDESGENVSVVRHDANSESFWSDDIGMNDYRIQALVTDERCRNDECGICISISFTRMMSEGVNTHCGTCSSAYGCSTGNRR